MRNTLVPLLTTIGIIFGGLLSGSFVVETVFNIPGLGRIAIDSGALAALGGGLLRFKSEEAKQVLQSGGDQVALMLQALENFTYERLGVDIDKSLAGNARVTLRTLGHNPAVLKGRKFQINVNLETNLDKLLEAALQWYRLSGRALRDIVAPGKRKGTR